MKTAKNNLVSAVLLAANWELADLVTEREFTQEGLTIFLAGLTTYLKKGLAFGVDEGEETNETV